MLKLSVPLAPPLLGFHEIGKGGCEKPGERGVESLQRRARGRTGAERGANGVGVCPLLHQGGSNTIDIAFLYAKQK